MRSIKVFFNDTIIIKNPLCVIIHSATGHFKEKNDEKYLVIDLTDKFEEILPGIRS